MLDLDLSLDTSDVVHSGALLQLNFRLFLFPKVLDALSISLADICEHGIQETVAHLM